MTQLPYDLTGPIGSDAILGLIVLRADETIEQDFSRIFNAQETAVYVTSAPLGTRVT